MSKELKAKLIKRFRTSEIDSLYNMTAVESHKE